MVKCEVQPQGHMALGFMDGALLCRYRLSETVSQLHHNTAEPYICIALFLISWAVPEQTLQVRSVSNLHSLTHHDGITA